MTRNNSITSEYDRKKRFWELIESNTNDTSFSNELNRLKSDRFGSKVSLNGKRSQMNDKTEVTSDDAEQTSHKTERTSYNFDKISNFSSFKLQTKPKFEKVHEKDFDKIKEFDKVLSNFSENFVKETNKKEKGINQPKEKRRNQERFSSKTSTYHVLGLDELTRINKGIRGIRKKDDKEYVIEIKAGDIPKKSALKPESKKNEVKKEIPVIKKYTAVRVTNTPEVKETVCIKNNFSFTPQTENKRKNTILVTEPISPNSPLFSYSPKSKIVFNNNFKKYTLNTEECFKNIKQNFFNKNEEKEVTSDKMHEMKEIQTKETTQEFKETKEHEEKEESLMKSIENISVHSKESNKKENFENNIGMKEDYLNYKNLDKYEEITLSTLSTSTVNLYSPGKVLKDFPKLKILHIEYSLDDTFLIIKVNDWLIRKNYDLIRKFIKPNEALTYDPYRNKINKEIIEINLNSKLMKDIPSLQSFILTDLIDNYSLKNDYLLMYDKEWSKVKLIKVNDKFILYRKNEIYKMFSKKEINLEKVNNLVFKLYLENTFVTLGVNSLEEMNEWIEFINS